MKTAAIVGIGVLALLLLKGQPVEASSDEIEDYNPGDFVPNDPETPANPGDGWIEATPEPQTVSTKFAIGDRIKKGSGNTWLITGIDPNKFVRKGETGAYILCVISTGNTPDYSYTAYESFIMADQFYVKVG